MGGWDEIMVTTFREIVDDVLGAPGLLDYPWPIRVNKDAMSRLPDVRAAAVEGAGAGRGMEWVVDEASLYPEDYWEL